MKPHKLTDVLYVKKIMKNVKKSENTINIPQSNLNNIKLQLFIDASFNNLPNRGSQAGQIIFLTDDKSNTCPLYWNSSKLKRVVTIAAETLSLSERCDLAMYIKKLVSEFLFNDGKQLNIIAYIDNQSLYDVVHTLKQTLEKQLLVDISAIREMVEKNEIDIWIEKTK